MEHEHSAKADGQAEGPCQADGNGTSNNHEIKRKEGKKGGCGVCHGERHSD